MITRRDFLTASLGGCAAAFASTLGGCATTRHSSGSRPNIVFIMSDDQGAWAWGQGGHADALTPNLDRLRGQGAHLANYFVTCPVCSPARASMLSSRYPTELGIIDYLGGSVDPNIGLDPELPTWPKLLDEGGYDSAFFGKWHVGSQDRYLPQRFGYDEFKGWRQGAGISIDPDVEIGGELRHVEGFTPDIITDYAVDFLEADHSRPFLLSLHFFAPHANTDNFTEDGDRTWLPVSEADWAPFQDLDPTFPEPMHPKLDVPRATRMTREYLASVHGMDRNVGRVLDALDRLDLAGNTIVVFTSDHGFNMAHHGIWHKGNGRWLLVDNEGQRANMWDTSLRAPAFVRWPGRIRPGTTVTETTSNLDWFPTLLAMTGAPLPSDAVVRGHNVHPLLQGQSPQWNNDFFAQYMQWEERSDVNMRAYRTPDWKLIRDFTREGEDELYHLAEDPKELANLIDSSDPETVQMRKMLDIKLRKAMDAIGDDGSRRVAIPPPP